MKSYAYYSDGGYRFFYLNDSTLREITTENYYGLPESAIYYCSHYGLKMVYRILPEKKLMLALLNIPSEMKDDSGRKIPFSIILIGVQSDLTSMNKLAAIICDSLTDFGHFVSKLFCHNAEGQLYFDYLKLDTFIDNVQNISFPATNKHLLRIVQSESHLIIYEGSSLKSSLKEFEDKFTQKELDDCLILNMSEALAYQNSLGIDFRQLTEGREKDVDDAGTDLLLSIEALSNKNLEQVADLKRKEEQITALQNLLSEKDDTITTLKQKLLYFTGSAFFLGLVVGLLC